MSQAGADQASPISGGDAGVRGPGPGAGSPDPCDLGRFGGAPWWPEVVRIVPRSRPDFAPERFRIWKDGSKFIGQFPVGTWGHYMSNTGFTFEIANMAPVHDLLRADAGKWRWDLNGYFPPTPIYLPITLSADGRKPTWGRHWDDAVRVAKALLGLLVAQGEIEMHDVVFVRVTSYDITVAVPRPDRIRTVHLLADPIIQGHLVLWPVNTWPHTLPPPLRFGITVGAPADDNTAFFDDGGDLWIFNHHFNGPVNLLYPSSADWIGNRGLLCVPRTTTVTSPDHEPVILSPGLYVYYHPRPRRARTGGD